jgi:hypothetical protein
MELIEDSSAFEGLREEWNGLLAESSAKCFFLTWEWLYTWWKHLSQGRKLSILAVRLGTELVAVAPLVLKRSTFRDLSPFRSLGFLGVTAVGSDYVDFIVKCGKEQEACQVLADHLAGTGLMVEFRQLKRAASVGKDERVPVHQSVRAFVGIVHRNARTRAPLQLQEAAQKPRTAVRGALRTGQEWG